MQARASLLQHLIAKKHLIAKASSSSEAMNREKLLEQKQGGILYVLLKDITRTKEHF